MSQGLPQFLGNVWRKGDSRSTICSIAVLGRRSALVKKFVNSIIRAMAVLKDRLAMSSVTALIVLCKTHLSGRWVNVANRTVEPHFLGLVIDNHPPQTIEKTEDAVDPFHVPWFHLLERAHKHFVEPK